MEIKNHLTDLIEPETLRKIESSLSAMFGMAAWISDENGVGVDSGTGFPRYADLCLRSPDGREDCERCIREGAERSDDSKQPGRSECLGGLTVFSAPIKAADKTVGILSGGWVLMEDPDFDKICQTAKSVGEDANLLSSAMAEVRIISDDEASRAAVYIRDFAGILSEMAKKSAEVQRVNAAAAKAAEHRSDFLANVSHEMRTPLNAILGMTEMALHKDMSQDAKEYVHQIRSSGRHLLTIINDILDYSNIDSGEMPIVEVKYEPLSLVNDVAAMVNSQIGSKDIEFTIDLPTSMPQTLIGDNVRIQQILVNLLNNAVKFTHSGHIGLKLKTVPQKNGTVLLKAEVSDTGCGIKQDNIDKLFKMFRQVDTKRNRNVEGTGLGLAISRKLLTLMNGDISVKSEYGKGSTFFFELPQKSAGAPYSEEIKQNGLPAYINIGNQYLRKQLVKDLTAVGAKITDVSGRPSACGSSGYLIVSRDRFGEDAKGLLSSNSELLGIILERYDSVEQFNIPNVEVVNKPAYSMNLYAAMGLCDGFERDSSGEDAELSFTAPDAHILIVDDNAINLSVAKGVIEPLGMQVDTAMSAAECIEKVRSCRYDIVFMDHMMPEVDGIEATHMIREKFPAYADVPIIALTANVSGGAHEMFLKEGMNDFIAKPIELRDMVNKIRRWLSEEKIVPVSAARNQKQQPAAIQAESAGTFPRIRGIDTESAMALLKNEALLKSVMEQFYRSIERNESRIRTLWKNNDIKNFTIEVHALKSTAKQIGANHLSSVCALLEQAGNNHDIDFISRHTNAMLIEYLRLKQEMGKYFTEANKPVFLSGYGTNSGPANSPAPAAMAPATQEERDLFKEMQNALEEMDTIQIDDVMEKLSAGQYGLREMEYFERLKNAVDEYDLDAAQEVLTQWRKNKGAM